MEWVETTGRTLEEAKEAALDQLGVAAEDAEFDVVEEPRSGLFGRVRQEARVRARVRPTSPRPKAERRDRKRRTPEAAPAAAGPVEPQQAPAPAAAGGRVRGGRRAAVAPVIDDVAEELAADVVGEGAAVEVQDAPESRPAGDGGGGRRPAPVRGRGTARGTTKQEEVATNGAAARRRGAADVETDEPTLAEQRETVKEFLEGLVDAFGASATTEVEEVDEDTLEARVVGDDLGLLIGPKGATLQAVQEITRTVVQRAAEPGRGARLRVDIGGYREHRREALGRFTRQIADQVLDSGNPVALEPMSPPDRKVVHDTVNEIDGVISSSEGDDPDRRVVISPA